MEGVIIMLMKILVILIGLIIYNLSYVYLHSAGFGKKVNLVLMITGNIIMIGVAIFLFVKNS